MDNDSKVLDEEYIPLQKELPNLNQGPEDKNRKYEVLNIQIQKLEDDLERLDMKREHIVNKSLSKRENISRKIDLFVFLPLGSGTILFIILFGVITGKIGIMFEYICAACLSISAIMVLKMVIEMVIDSHIMEKSSKTEEYTNIENLRKKVEKTLEEIKSKRDVLKEAKDIEIEQYNDKVQRLHEVEFALSENASESQIDNMKTLFEDTTKGNAKPKKRIRRKKITKNTGDI